MLLPFTKNLKTTVQFLFVKTFFVKLTFSVMLKFFMENDLITSNQSGYKPWMFVYQSTSIYSSWIFKLDWSSNCGNDVRDVFLDNSKAFDKIQQNTPYMEKMICLTTCLRFYKTNVLFHLHQLFIERSPQLDPPLPLI